MEYGENSENDIWGNVDEIDELSTPENEQDEDAGLEKAKPEPSELDRVAAELDDLADGKAPAEQSKIVKGIQRVVARKDNELKARDAQIAAQQAALDAYEARMAQIEEQLLVTAEGATLTWDMLNANLEDDPRKEAELEAHRRNLAVQQKVAEQRTQRTQRQAPPPQQQYQPDDAWEATLANQIALEQQEFANQARATATAFGVDPDNPALDYGLPTEKFNTRFAKLNASLSKARTASTEDAVKAVRGNPISTRGANSGEPVVSANTGLSALEIGSRQRLEMMRKASA